MHESAVACLLTGLISTHGHLKHTRWSDGGASAYFGFAAEQLRQYLERSGRPCKAKDRMRADAGSDGRILSGFIGDLPAWEIVPSVLIGSDA